MLASLEVSVFVLFVTFVIWEFTDNDMQKWLDRSAFGLERKKLNDAYTNSKRQMDDFGKALTEVI
jgi:hypothetical protein